MFRVSDWIQRTYGSPQRCSEFLVEYNLPFTPNNSNGSVLREVKLTFNPVQHHQNCNQYLIAQEERKYCKENIGLYETGCIGCVGRCKLQPAFGHPMARNRHTRLSKFIFGILNFEPPNLSGRLLFHVLPKLDHSSNDFCWSGSLHESTREKTQMFVNLPGGRPLCFSCSRTLHRSFFRSLAFEDLPMQAWARETGDKTIIGCVQSANMNAVHRNSIHVVQCFGLKLFTPFGDHVQAQENSKCSWRIRSVFVLLMLRFMDTQSESSHAHTDFLRVALPICTGWDEAWKPSRTWRRGTL